MTDITTTVDPDPRLLVDGRLMRPDRVEGRRYSFDVPAGAAEVRIISRSVIPARLDPTLGDQRRLGLSLLEIELRSPQLEMRLWPDDPALIDGFHAAEPGHRWTDGRALLPASVFAPFRDGFVLELLVNETPLRYPLA